MSDPRLAAKKLWWRLSSILKRDGAGGTNDSKSASSAKAAVGSAVSKTAESARGLWADHRREVLIGGAAALALILGLVGYLILKRPADVLDESAQFTADQPEPVFEKVNWPTYGLNNSRTRYLPALKVHPPYKRTWSYRSEPLLEFSPIVVENTLYAIDNDGFAFALDSKSGKVKWKRKIAKLNATSPAYADGRLYIANMDPSQVMALDAETGKTIWERGLPGRSETSPAVEGDKVIVGTRSGHLLGIDRERGKADWRIKLAGEVKGGVATKNGIAYIGDYGSEF